MLVRYILERLYAASIPKKESIDQCAPLVKMVVLIETIILAIIAREPQVIAILLLFPITVLFTRKDYSVVIEALKAPLPIALIITGFSALFTPWTANGFYYLVTLFLRIIVIASSMLVFVSTTNPMHIAYIMEKIRLPKWLVLSSVLIWRLIPITLLTASEAYAVTRLKGDKPWRSLVASSAVSLLRAIHTMEALYMYGAGTRDFTLKPFLGKINKAHTIAYVVTGLCILAYFIIVS